MEKREKQKKYFHNLIFQGLRLNSIWLFNIAFAQKHHLVKQNITDWRQTDRWRDRQEGGWMDRRADG